MRALALLILLIMPLFSAADCGCGAKCAMYTGPAKCTRCCTTAVKRSLLLNTPRRSHRFLLPGESNQIRLPMWLQPAATIREASSIMKHRRHRRPARRCLLDDILAAAIDKRGNS